MERGDWSVRFAWMAKVLEELRTDVLYIRFMQGPLGGTNPEYYYNNNE